MCAVSRYRDARMGMEWRCVLQRLTTAGVEPIEADEIAASAALVAADTTAEEVHHVAVLVVSSRLAAAAS